MSKWRMLDILPKLQRQHILKEWEIKPQSWSPRNEVWRLANTEHHLEGPAEVVTGLRPRPGVVLSVLTGRCRLIVSALPFISAVWSCTRAF